MHNLSIFNKLQNPLAVCSSVLAALLKSSTLKSLPSTFVPCPAPWSLLLVAFYITSEFIFCILQQIQTVTVPTTRSAQTPARHAHCLSHLPFVTRPLLCTSLSARSAQNFPPHSPSSPPCGGAPSSNSSLVMGGHLSCFQSFAITNKKQPLMCLLYIH